jgi:hypothetical protein
MGVRWLLPATPVQHGRARLGRARPLGPVGYIFFSFLFSYFFYNFCILAPNELKPVSKFL